MFLSLLIPTLPPDGPTAAPHTAMVQPAASRAPADLVLCDCRDAESPDTPEGRPLGASVSPAWSHNRYVRDTQGRAVDISQAKVSILEMPKHGEFEGNWQSKTGGTTFGYMPEPGFRGKDQASFLLEVDGQRVKVVYTLYTVEMLADDPINCTGHWPKRIGGLEDEVPALGLSGGWGQKPGSKTRVRVDFQNPGFHFLEGDISMFVIDVPDVPPQQAPVVVSSVSQESSQSVFHHRIGVCHLASNLPEDTDNAINSLSPVGSAWQYLKSQGDALPVPVTDEMFLSASVTLLGTPQHGSLSEDGGVDYHYTPTPGFTGVDGATLLVTMGPYQVKTVYHFNAAATMWGGTEGYDPYEDKCNCPAGEIWKISLDLGATEAKPGLE